MEYAVRKSDRVNTLDADYQKGKILNDLINSQRSILQGDGSCNMILYTTKYNI